MPTKPFYLVPRSRIKGKPIFYAKFRDPSSGELGSLISTGKTNKTDAEAWAQDHLAELVRESAVPSMLVREFVEPFYGEDCPYVRKMRNTKGMNEKTRIQKRRYVEGIILKCDWLMDMKLGQVRRVDLEAFRDDYLIAECFDDEASRTTQAIMEVVKTVLSQAVEKGHLLQNPVFRLPTGKYEAVERQAISEAQLDELMKREHYGSDRQHRATLVAATTGLRAGEVRGLQWQDLRKDEKIIRIERALKNEDSTVSLPKWGKRRTCPYPKVLRTLLEPLRGDPGTFVFAWGDECLNYRRWKDAFYRACEKAKIDCTLHGLRHTLNTLLLIRGIPDAVIRAALGWSDPKIQQRYTHIKFGDQYKSPIIDSIKEAIYGEG